MRSDKTTVLIVDDEPAIIELVKYSLREADWNCCSTQNVADAWDCILHRTPHLILLDWMLPDQTGMSLLSRIRADHQLDTMPVIMLTAKKTEEDKLAGFNNGADDYITKPFSPRELLARTKALLRSKSECGGRAQALMRAANVVLDPVSCSVTIDAKKVEIGHAEYKLLKFLLANPERVFSRSQLLAKVWGGHAVIEERTVDVYVLRLRKALREAENLIRTVRSVGYMLSVK